jgi:hypothetical protein
MPIRPLRLAGDGLHAGPREPFATDANAVTDRAALTEHVIQSCVAGIDDHGAWRFTGIKRHISAAQPLGNYIGVALIQRGIARRERHIV